MRFCASAMRRAAWGTLSIMAPSEGTSSCTSGSCASMKTPLCVASPTARKNSAVCSTACGVESSPSRATSGFEVREIGGLRLRAAAAAMGGSSAVSASQMS